MYVSPYFFKFLTEITTPAIVYIYTMTYWLVSMIMCQTICVLVITLLYVCVSSQLSELRQRLERAEADRQELQEELRMEREAREKLERTITQLKQQMARSGTVGGSPSPPPTPSTGPPNAHSPPSSSSSSISEAPAAGQK